MAMPRHVRGSRASRQFAMSQVIARTAAAPTSTPVRAEPLGAPPRSALAGLLQSCRNTPLQPPLGGGAAAGSTAASIRGQVEGRLRAEAAELTEAAERARMVAEAEDGAPTEQAACARDGLPEEARAAAEELVELGGAPEPELASQSWLDSVSDVKLAQRADGLGVEEAEVEGGLLSTQAGQAKAAAPQPDDEGCTEATAQGPDCDCSTDDGQPDSAVSSPRIAAKEMTAAAAAAADATVADATADSTVAAAVAAAAAAAATAEKAAAAVATAEEEAAAAAAAEASAWRERCREHGVAALLDILPPPPPLPPPATKTQRHTARGMAASPAARSVSTDGEGAASGSGTSGGQVPPPRARRRTGSMGAAIVQNRRAHSSQGEPC